MTDDKWFKGTQKQAQERAAHEAKYPEHQKLRAIHKKSQVVHDFIEWLESQGIEFAKYDRAEDQWTSFHTETRQDIVARYFEIDMTVIDAEKQAMIEEIS